MSYLFSKKLPYFRNHSHQLPIKGVYHVCKISYRAQASGFQRGSSWPLTPYSLLLQKSVSSHIWTLLCWNLEGASSLWKCWTSISLRVITFCLGPVFNKGAVVKLTSYLSNFTLLILQQLCVSCLAPNHNVVLSSCRQIILGNTWKWFINM